MYTNMEIQRDSPDLNDNSPTSNHFIPFNQRVQNRKL